MTKLTPELLNEHIKANEMTLTPNYKNKTKRVLLDFFYEDITNIIIDYKTGMEENVKELLNRRESIIARRKNLVATCVIIAREITYGRD